MISQPGPEAPLRTTAERQAAAAYAQAFEQCPDDVQTKLANFTKYVRRQDLTRLLSRYEIFKQVLDVKGSIVECGVFRGFGLMAWANFSAVMEPANLTRRIYGFDSFAGFLAVGDADRNARRAHESGDLRADAYEELQQLVRVYDTNRFLGHVDKVHLVKGAAEHTIPDFVEAHPHLVVSLLFLDFDLYEPTRVALEHFVPRMPKGAILALDELDNPMWPGETKALLDTLAIGRLRLRRAGWDPYIAYAVIE
ncbi:MAG: class I SAM-dependent methyltransferase [Candidatus Eisenbacteria bacterium]|uniref:Class I SAM-dependent methyltransferase n=1 Tax=Eiseniibacteriota bacterium TaxID=2212470 RepID=A0A538TXS5_UNCEI|nr:MAG: class I SAM-dependent methyltransferase [Candidatus Eisenbacteria bacterium]